MADAEPLAVALFLHHSRVHRLQRLLDAGKSRPRHRGALVDRAVHVVERYRQIALIGQHLLELGPEEDRDHVDRHPRALGPITDAEFASHPPGWALASVIELAEGFEPIGEIDEDYRMAEGVAVEALRGEGRLLLLADEGKGKAPSHAVAEIARPADAVPHGAKLSVPGLGGFAAIEADDRLIARSLTMGATGQQQEEGDGRSHWISLPEIPRRGQYPREVTNRMHSPMSPPWPRPSLLMKISAWSRAAAGCSAASTCSSGSATGWR